MQTYVCTVLEPTLNVRIRPRKACDRNCNRASLASASALSLHFQGTWQNLSSRISKALSATQLSFVFVQVETMRPIVLVLVSLVALANVEAAKHVYKENEKIILWANKGNLRLYWVCKIGNKPPTNFVLTTIVQLDRFLPPLKPINILIYHSANQRQRTTSLSPWEK